MHNDSFYLNCKKKKKPQEIARFGATTGNSKNYKRKARTMQGDLCLPEGKKCEGSGEQTMSYISARVIFLWLLFNSLLANLHVDVLCTLNIYVLLYNCNVF